MFTHTEYRRSALYNFHPARRPASGHLLQSCANCLILAAGTVAALAIVAAVVYLVANAR